MKKALLLLAAAAACAIALPATAARNKTLKGSGRIVTETRDVGSFHAVEAAASPTSSSATTPQAA